MSSTPVSVGRPTRSGSNAFWSGLDAAAIPVSSLLMTAGLVRALGAEQYGMIVIALAASGLSTAVSPAIATATTKFVSEAVGSRVADSRTVGRVIAASLLVVSVLNLVLLAGAVAFQGPLSRFVFGRALGVGGRESSLLLVFAVLTICIQQVDGVFAAAIRGLERFREQALVQFASRMFVAIIVTLVAWLTRNAPLAVLAQSGAYALSLWARAAVLKQVAPEKRIMALPSGKELRAVTSFGGWMWLTAIAGVVYGTADRILIGRVMGAAAAGEFNVIIQVTQLIHFVPSSLFAFSFPTFSRLIAEGGDGRARTVSLYRRYQIVIIAMACAIGLAVTLGRSILMNLFLPGRGSEEGLILPYLVLVAGFVLLACNVASYYALLGLGRSQSLSLTSVAAMGLSLATMVVLIPVMGMQGAALARVAYGLAALPLVYMARRALAKV